MKWISVKDKLPKGHGPIVAIMGFRQEQTGDPIKSGDIVILRGLPGSEWRNMDEICAYWLPEDEQNYYETIQYWMPWEHFLFPEEMIVDEVD